MRLRPGPRGLPREAPPDPQLSGSARPELLARLRAASLYVITPDADAARIVEVAQAALRGGADVLQLRHKESTRGDLLALAHRIRELAAAAERIFIVNDHVDIALLSHADGVHLGPDDLTVESARRVAGERLIIGASAASSDAAREAIAAGADYLGSGPAFATPVKSQKTVIGPAGIAAVAAAAGPMVPVFAIGGIDESNLGQLIAIGLRRVCVIRAVASAADPESATRRLRAMLDR